MLLCFGNIINKPEANKLDEMCTTMPFKELICRAARICFLFFIHKEAAEVGGRRGDAQTHCYIGVSQLTMFP